MSPADSIFGAPIFTYSRAAAIEDGLQIEVPEATSREAGIKFPVMLTKAVYDLYVDFPECAEGQDIEGRLWDVLSMLAGAIRREARPGIDRIWFSLYVRNHRRRLTLVRLLAVVSALDVDDPRPAITIQLPTES